MPNYTTILVEEKQVESSRVLTITLNRPQRRNALTSAMIHELTLAFRARVLSMERVGHDHPRLVEIIGLVTGAAPSLSILGRVELLARCLEERAGLGLLLAGGLRIEPPVSEPMATRSMRAAVDAPEPLDDPPA